MPSAASAVLERVRSWCLRQKLNCCRLAFLDPLTVLWRRENETRVFLSSLIWKLFDLETMRVISRCDLELDPRTLLDADR